MKSLMSSSSNRGRPEGGHMAVNGEVDNFHQMLAKLPFEGIPWAMLHVFVIQ